VDKKRLLIKSLAKIMNDELPKIDAVVANFPTAAITIKEDGSPVTELDLRLSWHVEMLMNQHFTDTTFYSEEKYSEWSFPLLALDPLDGTQEYIDGRDEWALSIGLFETDKLTGQGWVYNPKTQECFEKGKFASFVEKPFYRGEVSRSEWKKGLFTGKASEKFHLEPVVSIAYKLGRLSAGKCDYVVSLRPKNIWDIAGGTLLCKEAGFKFYSQGKEVTSVEKLYLPPLIWCHEEIFSQLSQIYP
jgi:myo-inositol-1(or 4)-monophosphatase